MGRHAGLYALLIGALVGCAVDRRAPFAQPEYVEAIRRIEGGPGPRVGAGAFRAGWAKVEIQVPAGAPLAGYGERGGAAHLGVRDPVYVRALAIGAGEARVVLLASDLLLLDAETSQEIRDTLAPLLPREALMFSASHTHSGPGAYAQGLIWELVFGAYAEESRRAVVQAHVSAVEQALLDQGPATVGASEIAGPASLIANRVERGGPVDEVLYVLSVEREGGRRAAWWSYGCHAVTLPASNLLLSADYPGQIAAQFEGRGLELLAFSAGGVGSSNPAREQEDTRWLVDPLSRRLERGLEQARAQAKREGRVAVLSRTVPLPPVNYRIGEGLRLFAPLVQALTRLPRVLELRAVAIDQAVILQLPAELSGNLSRGARASARRAGLKLAITPFNGTYVGYLVPRRVYDLPEIERGELHAYETQVMTFFGPYGGDLMINYGLRLAARTAAAAQAPIASDGE